MKDFSMAGWVAKSLPIAAGIVLAAACAHDNGPPSEKYGTATAAIFANGDFELGAANMPPPSWIVDTFLNLNGVLLQTPQTRAGLQLSAGGTAKTVTLDATPAGPLSQCDAQLGCGTLLAPVSLRWPRYGHKVALVNQVGTNNNVNSFHQTITLSASDVDPTDNTLHIRFAAAPVLEIGDAANHTGAQQPYFYIDVINITKANAIIYQDFNFSNQAGVPWKTATDARGNQTDYTDWQLVDIPLTSAQAVQGDQVEVEVIAAGCSLGGHFGEVYLDGVGPTVPGIFVSGKGPSQVNLAGCPATTPLTYNLTYHNGGAAAETGVIVDFTTPPNTTFQSFMAPAGVVCLGPVAGTPGTVTCNVGSLAAGASGTIQVTVNVACTATGTIVAGTYDIKSNEEPALEGNKITTIIGCTKDTDCASGNWCNETTSKCTPTLASGQPIPIDAPHTNPTLSGMCTGPAATLVCTAQVCDVNNLCGYENGNGPCTVANGSVVCQSAVCDPNDLKCGFVNGDGPCTIANQGTVCRSGACDGNDSKCGYANGDGPCTVLNQGTVCRSGACSVSGVCEPAGGCEVDADCAAGNWCNETSHTCTPKLPNGTAVPNDPGHTNPTLNGTCTAAAGLTTCVSGVCDTADNECGYANGDGPCTMGNGVVVCRSGACSTNGTCVPNGGCNVDSDCTGGNWCAEATHTCTPKLPNGQPVPTDPPHSNPTLNGTCTAAAGTLTCVSGVCDTNDNQCGYANNDGPCTPATGGTVCRSGFCTLSGVCEPNGGCFTDSDCGAGNWCNETSHTCTPQLDNGTAIPTDSGHMNPMITGTCTTQVGTIVCKSGVCDTTDNKCGYANGDGPCDMTNGMTVCRSQNCTTGGVCEPAGGCIKDSDCPMGNWCNETSQTCTPQLPNGQPVPTDTAHTNPTLDGTCTTQAGTVTCKSGVCDTKDNECGYANGDGPCTMANGGSVCRSQNCATTGPNNGKCVACVSDTMCPMNEKCDMTTNTCVACETDSDCGGPMSGMVCGTTHDCIMGCRGMGGNGCPTTQMCTSTDKTIGQCIDITMTTSTTTSTGTDMSTTGAGGGGTGGANNGGAFIQGHGVFGCSVGVGVDGSSSIAGALGLLVLAGRRRRRR